MNRPLALLACLVTGVALAQTPAPFTESEVRELIQRQANGDLDAYYIVGAAMLRGDRLERDVAGGLEQLGHAAERGHGRSLLMLASWYDHIREAERARSYLQRALQTGDPVVHFEFAMMLDEMLLFDAIPDEDERDRRRVQALERAATGGIVEAMSKLGWHYRSEDEAQAVHWFEQAAMRRHHDSIINLAELLKTRPALHDGTFKRVAERDPVAAAWLRLELGAAYELRTDNKDALRRAAAQYAIVAGDEGALEQLRLLARLRYARLAIQLDDGGRAVATDFLKQAADAGSLHAQCFLAVEYDEDGLLPTDVAASEAWQQKLRARLSEDEIDTVCTEMYVD